MPRPATCSSPSLKNASRVSGLSRRRKRCRSLRQAAGRGARRVAWVRPPLGAPGAGGFPSAPRQPGMCSAQRARGAAPRRTRSHAAPDPPRRTQAVGILLVDLLAGVGVLVAPQAARNREQQVEVQAARPGLLPQVVIVLIVLVQVHGGPLTTLFGARPRLIRPRGGVRSTRAGRFERSGAAPAAFWDGKWGVPRSYAPPLPADRPQQPNGWPACDGAARADSRPHAVRRCRRGRPQRERRELACPRAPPTVAARAARSRVLEDSLLKMACSSVVRAARAQHHAGRAAGAVQCCVLYGCARACGRAPPGMH
jgi:hypothetical protein